MRTGKTQEEHPGQAVLELNLALGEKRGRRQLAARVDALKRYAVELEARWKATKEELVGPNCGR